MASRFDTSGIDLRIVNGDGAQWIQKKKGIKTIAVLDKYHRNKKITECAGNTDFSDNLRKLLYAGDTDMVLTCIEAQINSLLPEESEKEIEKLQELYSYFAENKEALFDTPENADLLDGTILAISHAAWDEISDEMSEVLGYIDTPIEKKGYVGDRETSGGNWFSG